LYPWTFCIYGRFVERTFCREGRYVEGRFVDGRFVEGRFVEGRFVLVPMLEKRQHVIFIERRQSEYYSCRTAEPTSLAVELVFCIFV
jgi:hypothetical protein